MYDFLNVNGDIPVDPGDKKYNVMTNTKIYKVVFLEKNPLPPSFFSTTFHCFTCIDYSSA